ncbi:hypothetical protein [Corynebacterium propinquum]|nr:hypothetical protein [Corynebacterium propinquum]UQV60116.1 hypothetical protein L9H28_10175 [Corynebacterium propinquum]
MLFETVRFVEKIHSTAGDFPVTCQVTGHGAVEIAVLLQSWGSRKTGVE